MKMIKTEVMHEDDDGDDSHVLLGFDESTNYLQSKSASETETPKTEMTPNGGGGAGGGGGVGPYFRWTPESIKMMLNMRFEMDRDFAQRLRQKKDLWNEIATEMGRSGGYAITGEVCDLKFRNMLQTFKKNRRKEERGMQELIIWEYYTLFKQAALHSIDAGGDSFTPSMLCESVCIEDTTTTEGASATTKQQQQYNDKVVVPDLAAEADKGQKESLITPRKQSARRKRPRSISAQVAVNSEGSSGEQEQLSIEAKKALLQLEQISLQQQSSSSPATEGSEQTSEQQGHQSETSSSAFSKIESQVAWTMHPPAPPQSQLTTSQPTPPPPPPPPPPTPQAEWLTPTEQSECEVFGQSVGLQLANLRDPFARSLLKLKIQELFFLATMGKLPGMSGN